MWINSEVNFPEALLSAQNDGSLVVFAGAGISTSGPSNLPNFFELAGKVSADAMDPPNDDHPLDRYLGILESRGVNVQIRTREIIDDPASRPTLLHRDLLALFSNADQVRIITTNFDRHFTTSGRESFGDDLNIYYGPAIPLGRDFHGLVYLHGAVEHSSHPLVLTDGDFGRAYLTDGWATRMLMEMFNRYTVLFIGYSHNDPIMNYLARGLVPASSRYALTAPGDETRWMHLGITPVTFPWRGGPDKFGAVPAAISAWVRSAKLGTLEHEERIRTVVTTSPPVEPDIQDYLEAALHDQTRVRFFTRHARRAEWLRWVEDKNAFGPLFQDEIEADESCGHLAHWVAEHYAIEHAGEALALVTRQGLHLNWILWSAISRAMGFRDDRPEASIASAWAAILVQSARPGWAHANMGQWLTACRHPEDRTTALILFRHMTRPRLILDRFNGAIEPDEASTLRLHTKFRLEGEAYHLQEAWTSLFTPHLEDWAEELIAIVEDRIREVHQSFRATGAASETWDPVSYRRSAIEPHPQDRFREDADFLIDAARDLIDWMLKNMPRSGNVLINRWIASEVPLLRRLAIHGMIEAPDRDADQVLDDVLTHGWLYANSLKHEVFQLIRRWYPEASPPARDRFVRQSLEIPVVIGRATGVAAREISEHERYNLAVWLTRSDPHCTIARNHLTQLQGAHPQFEPRDHLDLNAWVGEMVWVEPQSPVSDSELLSKKPDEWLELFTTYQESGSRQSPTRDGLLVDLRSAVRQSVQWGWELASALEEREEWKDDLWKSIIEGWKAGSLSGADWDRILALVDRRANLDSLGSSVMDLIEHGLQTDAIPIGALVVVERIADRFFGVATSVSMPEPEGVDNWLTSAINHLGGDVAQVWMLALAKRQSVEGSEWDGLPEGYRTRLEEALANESQAGRLAAVILAARTAFLYNVDMAWSRTHLLPLFDWTIDLARARQAWHGYLFWGQWTDPLFKEMLPTYEQCFGRLDLELASMREAFCLRVAAIALRSTVHPLESGWLSRFIREADPDSLGQWSSAVTDGLRVLPSAEKEAIWHRWLSEYWTNRITGVPRPFEAKEIAELPEWALQLGPVFPQAVEHTCATADPFGEHRLKFYVLRDHELGITYPTPMARLVHHLLRSSQHLRYDCEYVDETVRQLLSAGADAQILSSICEEMARLGCRTAAELKSILME